MVVNDSKWDPTIGEDYKQWQRKKDGAYPQTLLHFFPLSPQSSSICLKQSHKNLILRKIEVEKVVPLNFESQESQTIPLNRTKRIEIANG